MKSAVESANEEESGKEEDAYTVYLCFYYSVDDVSRRIAASPLPIFLLRLLRWARVLLAHAWFLDGSNGGTA